MRRDVVFREDVFSFAKEDSSAEQSVLMDIMSNSNVLFQGGQRYMPVHQLSQNTHNEYRHEISIPEALNSQQYVSHELVQAEDQPEIQVTAPDMVRAEPAVPNRRSTRDRHTPKWMKDFISLNINTEVSYPMCNYICYNHLSPAYQSYLVAKSNPARTYHLC